MSTPEERLIAWRAYLGVNSWLGRVANVVVPQLEEITSRRSKRNTPTPEVRDDG